MAAILIETLVPDAGAACQAALADWVSYVPNVTWTYNLTNSQGLGRKYLETVINDTVNVTTRRYYANDVKVGQFVSVIYLAGLPGVQDLSPPVLPPAYGIRDVNTSYNADFWVKIRPPLQAWSNSVGGNFGAQLIDEPQTGFVHRVYVQMLQLVGQAGFITGSLYTRDPALTTLVVNSVLPTLRSTGQGTIASPNSVTDATMQLILQALKDIAARESQISIDNGDSIYTVYGREILAGP